MKIHCVFKCIIVIIFNKISFYNASETYVDKINEKINKCSQYLKNSENKPNTGKISMNSENNTIRITRSGLLNSRFCLETYYNTDGDKSIDCCCGKIDLHEVSSIDISHTYIKGLLIKPIFVDYDYDLTKNSDIMISISKLVYGRTFSLSLTKLYIYDQTERLKFYKNKYKGYFNVATLVLCFPKICLRDNTNISDDNEIITFDFSKSLEKNIKWILYLDNENDKKVETELVSKITLTYDIILTDIIIWNQIFDTVKKYSIVDEIITGIIKEIKSIDTKDKIYMGVFLYNKYESMVFNNSEEDLTRYLSGIDLFFSIKLKEFNYNPRLCLLYSKIEFVTKAFCDKCNSCFDNPSNYPEDIFYLDNSEDKDGFIEDQNQEYVRFGDRYDILDGKPFQFSFIKKQKKIETLLLLNQETLQNKIPLYYEYCYGCDPNNLKTSINELKINIVLVWRSDGGAYE